MCRIGRLRLYLFIVIITLIESTLLFFISIKGMRPDLMLIFVIFVGLYSDWSEALEAGIVGGLLKGAMGIGSIGMSLVLFGLAGLFSAYLKNKVYRDNFLTQIILAFAFALFINMTGIFGRIVLKEADPVNTGLSYAFIPAVLLLSTYTAIFTPPVFFCLKKLRILKH